MQQISDHVFCDDFIASLKLDTRLMPNPYYAYPYLIIKGMLAPTICDEIVEYAYHASEAEIAKVKSTIHNTIVDPSVDEEIRKSLLHTLPQHLLDVYGSSFLRHQAEIESFFRVALTTSTPVQAIEYTKGSFYIRHADDSNELVNAEGETVGFLQIAPQRKLSSVLFTTSHASHQREGRDFTGGGLMFDYLFDSEGKAIEFLPEAGDMIVFPSNPIFSHEVLPVESGYRLTLVQWHNAIID